MEARAQIVPAAIRLAFFECIDNFNGLGQGLDCISMLRMRFERQNLAVDPKGVNPVTAAELKCFEQRSCVIQTNR